MKSFRDLEWIKSIYMIQFSSTSHLKQLSKMNELQEPRFHCICKVLWNVVSTLRKAKDKTKAPDINGLVLGPVLGTSEFRERKKQHLP